MTRGRKPTALEATPHIREVIEYARDRIEILPAGQIVAANVKSIVEKTGCNQVHGSFSSGVENGASPGKRLLQIMTEIQGSLEQLVG